jgi:hypothetical protein
LEGQLFAERLPPYHHTLVLIIAAFFAQVSQDDYLPGCEAVQHGTSSSEKLANFYEANVVTSLKAVLITMLL